MFVRKRRNKSGTISIQVIDKANEYRVVKTIGSTRDPEEMDRFVALGKRFIQRQSKQLALFPKDQRDNAAVLDFVQTLRHASRSLSEYYCSHRAVQMNILIMRAFIKLREMLATHKELARKVEEIERQQKEHGSQLAAVYSIVKRLIEIPPKPPKPIGFRTNQ
jgi:hypothetical protein